jgi:uncharacterized protein
MKVLDIIVTVMLVLGALNWGWLGIFNYNVIGAIFGEFSTLTRAIYAFVGLCGLYEAYNFTIGYNEMHHRWCETATSH